MTLARRAIVVCADNQLGRTLATALRAAGASCESPLTLDALPADLQATLVVVHEAGATAGATAKLLPLIGNEARVIAVMSKCDLAAAVDLMRASSRVTGVLVADPLDSAELAAFASRVLVGDIFGLEKQVPWGTQVHSQLVGDYQDKLRAIAQVAGFAEQMGVRRKYREAIEQCTDEMLMNALYDAPVDEDGKQIFAEIPAKTRIALRIEQKAILQYACDGRRFAISVRDAFGSLERATVFDYLHKCLHSAQQIDRKTGGAGLGLYMMASSSAAVYFNVLPGVATEATCVFDLESQASAIERIGFFTEQIDEAGRLASRPSRKLPTGAAHPVERRAPPVQSRPRALVALALASAIGVALALIAVLAWPRFSGAQKTTVVFETDPKGAAIEIEGKSAGTAIDGALAVGDLEIGHAYPVVARLDGYEPAQAVVEPHPDQRVRLALVARAATVTIDSQPTGATVVLAGKPAGVTPLVVTALAPGATVTFAMTKPGYHDATGNLAVPAPGKELHLIEPLTVAPIADDVARVHVDSDPEGAQVVQNGQLLAAVVTPADVLVEAGKPQQLVLTMAHRVPAILETFTPARGSDGTLKTVKLLPGTDVHFEANLDGKVTITNAPTCRDIALPATCVLPPGDYIAEVSGASSAHATRSFHVSGESVAQTFTFGFVQAANGKVLRVGAARAVPRAALEVGTRTVTVQDDAGTHAETVQVVANETAIAQ